MYNNNHNKILHALNKHKKIFTISLVLLVVCWFYLISPTITGYNVYKELEKQNATLEIYVNTMEELNDKIKESDYKIASYKEMLSKEYEESNMNIKLLSECENILSTSEIEFKYYKEYNEKNSIKDAEYSIKDIEYTKKEYELKIREIENINSNLQKELTNKDTSFNWLAENSARSICCRQRYDNPAINSYSVTGNSITCSSNGVNELSC